MLILNDILIDEDIFLQKFVCDIKACKGECCIEGDSGAPLLEKELDDLERDFPFAKEYLEEKTGCPVDIVRNHQNLNPRLRKRIDQHGITIF